MSDVTDPNLNPEEDPEPASRSRRRGKARERVRRRRERQQTQAAATSTGRRGRRHLRPAGGFEFPRINLAVVRGIVLVAGAVVFMLAIILVIGFFEGEPVEPDPNALWLDAEWTYTVHDDEAADDLVSRMQDNQIGEVYAHVSELNFDGTWTGLPDESNQFSEVENRVEALVKQLKERQGNLVLYGVINVRSDVDSDGYRLDDEQVWETVADFSSRIVTELGFDGVLLNVQPVWNNDENFLELVRAVRRSIGDDALLAVMTPPDWTPTDADIPKPSAIAPGTVWEMDYKRRVALLQIDQIVVRGYESYFARGQNFSAVDYAEWLAYQVEIYVDAIAYLENDTRLIVALSTQDDVRIQETIVVRDASIETLQAAIDGVKQGLENAGDDAAVFQGVALYSISEMDSNEWRQFRQLWVAE